MITTTPKFLVNPYIQTLLNNTSTQYFQELSKYVISYVTSSINFIDIFMSMNLNVTSSPITNVFEQFFIMKLFDYIKFSISINEFIIKISNHTLISQKNKNQSIVLRLRNCEMTMIYLSSLIRINK